jgi:O-antigen/teichoic acid export membrane protein
MLTTAINAGLGLAFWVAAARLYPPESVGLGAGAVSAMQLVATVGWVGLQHTLMRYLPVAGHRRGVLMGGAFAVAAVSALVTAALFLAGPATALGLGFLTSSLGIAIAFLAAAVIWVIFTLQDAVLVAIRRPFLVPIENTAFGTTKLIALIALAGTAAPWALFGAWAASAGALVLVMAFVIWRHREGYGSPDLPPARRLVSFSIGHTAVAIASWAPDYLVPLIVLSILGPVANAHYLAAWTVAFAAREFLMSVPSALTVEAAYGSAAFARLARGASWLVLAAVVPLLAILLVGAEPVLSLYAPGYVAGADLLRLLGLAIVPSIVVSYVVARDRNEHRYMTALALTALGSGIALILDVVLLPTGGLTAAGAAWLTGQSVSALLAILTLKPVLRRLGLR